MSQSYCRAVRSCCDVWRRYDRILEGTRFAFHEHEDHVEATCPWGNRICCYEPQDRFGPVVLGMPVIECDVPSGSAEAITRFYREIIGARAIMADRDGLQARIAVGIGQELVFRETKSKLPAYDGHHIQVYVANFSRPHKRLLERNLITEESNQYQYRFVDITDLETGKPLFQIEHEVRCMTHPLYARPLVNRNPRQTNRNYVQGRDGWVQEWEDADMGDPRRAMRQRRYEEATGRPLAAD